MKNQGGRKNIQSAYEKWQLQDSKFIGETTKLDRENLLFSIFRKNKTHPLHYAVIILIEIDYQTAKLSFSNLNPFGFSLKPTYVYVGGGKYVFVVMTRNASMWVQSQLLLYNSISHTLCLKWLLSGPRIH